MQHFKPSLITLALCAAGGSAFAQTSTDTAPAAIDPTPVIKFSGRVDVGIGSKVFGGGGTNSSEVVGDSSTGRLNISGTSAINEDVSSLFVLETRFNADTGAQAVDSGGDLTPTNQIFRDKSWVGLSSKKYGEINLGRVIAPIDSTGTPGRFEAFSGDSMASSGTRNAKSRTRWNNAVAYNSPVINGVKFTGAFSKGESPSYSNGAGIGVSYTGESLLIGVSYQSEQDTTLTNTYATDSKGAVTNSYSQGNDVRTTGFGVAYNFGTFTLLSTYARSEGFNITQTGTEAVTTFGVRVPYGPGEIRGTYRIIDDSNAKAAGDASSDKDNERLGLGYAWFLNKGTSMNVSWVRENAKTYNANGSEKTNLTGEGYEVAIRFIF